MLQGLGTTTHRSRNPSKAVLKPRKHRKVVKNGENARKSAEKRRKTQAKMKGLGGELATWEADREGTAQRLATKYSMKVKEVRKRMGAAPFKPSRKVSTYNAKISGLMAQLNECAPALSSI